MIPGSLFAISQLTVEDEIVMSLLVKDSTSPRNLRLCLKLFPNSPYRATFEQRLKRIELKNLSYKDKETYVKEKKHILGDYPNTALTKADEGAMARMVINSNSAAELRLFVKLFPHSQLQSRFSKKIAFLDSQKKRRKKEPTQIDSLPPPVEKMEEETIDEKIKEELLQEPPEETPVQEEQVAEPEEEPAKQEEKSQKVEEKPKEVTEKPPEETPEKKEEPEKKELEQAPQPQPERKEPEVDWGKWEIGIPTQLLLLDSSGNEVDTDKQPQGLFFGWSSEVLFDIGGGIAFEYFTQELPSEDEYQHLFMETHIRGRLFNIINWGIGYGGGLTTINLANKPSGYEVVPGQGIIYSGSVGFVWDSIGINYMVINFTGAYTWLDLSGSTGTVDWSGTLNMITLEYCY